MTPRTVAATLSAISFYFQTLGKGHAHGRTGAAVRASPARNDLVRDVLRGIRRRYGKPPVRKAPILLDSLERMIDQMPDTLLGKRDKAILALAWSGCRRASEVTGLDVRPDGDGWCEVDDAGITINLRRSKQNSMSKDVERYGIPARPTAPRYCPVVLLRAWLEAAGHKDGPLFRPVQTQKVIFERRLHPVSVSGLVKRAARRVGLDVSGIASHSLRAGCITWMALEGVSVYRIREQSGHRCMETLVTYIRPLRSPANSPLAETRWAR